MQYELHRVIFNFSNICGMQIAFLILEKENGSSPLHHPTLPSQAPAMTLCIAQYNKFEFMHL